MLFTPCTRGDLTLSNRIVMAPMTRCRANHADAIPNDLMVQYYRQRASAGLILAEGTPVSDRARGYINTPALWNEAQAEGWKKVTDAVHAAGGKIFVQLWHCGRVSNSLLHADRSPPAAPSARAAATMTFVPGPDGTPIQANCEAPRAMTTAEAEGVAKEFANAARLSKLAGFDGAEIHGANGYLLDQFRCPYLNDRNDKYGGSLENRYRMLLEVVDAVAAELGPERVCVRQSPRGAANDMQADPDPMGTYTWIAREMDKRRIGFLHIYDQSATWVHDPADDLLPALRQAYGGALMVCGGFKREKGEAVLARGADLVAIGKLFISNPDLVARLKTNVDLNPWDATTFYAGGPKGYIDYPNASE